MDERGDNAYSLAEKSGVPQPTIHRILSGIHGDPRTSTLAKIASAYKISVTKLRGDPTTNDNLSILQDDLRAKVEWLIKNADDEIKAIFEFMVQAMYMKKMGSKNQAVENKKIKTRAKS